ncbi:hypothetical protein TrRE_jg5593 [Triparma retinervis]|uniref:urease n=1 Tax=Triparma retinervis TaxID=2557542 RepID=A0A9W6ZLI3_9STRA|nr:hypothetical protein TrRE_jg5593 [Triparma retinervis]
MKLSPRECDHLLLHNVGYLAQKRLARGLRLNYVEATALIASVVMEKARDGNSSLVTVHNPIQPTNGDLSLALFGSFLPVPSLTSFPPLSYDPLTLFPPGYLFTPRGSKIPLNASKTPVLLTVMNTADRPIQVGSHYHFVECNPYLEFSRRIAYGRRLNIMAGTSVRFEPGEKKTVSLVEISGRRVVKGGNGLVDGEVEEVGNPPEEFIVRVVDMGFKHVEEEVKVAERSFMEGSR